MPRVLLAGCLLIAIAAIACSKPADSPPAQPTAVATQALSVAPTQPVSPAPSPAATATAAPAGIEVRGSEEFRAWTQRALELISSRASQEYAQVIASIRTIESVQAGSGMYVNEKRYAVGQVTAYAPGYNQEQQLVWYAGTIVHDACHSALFSRGRPHTGKEAEVTCLRQQKAALEKLDTSTFFSGYVQSLIDGADDPANQYWNQPNRHW